MISEKDFDSMISFFQKIDRDCFFCHAEKCIDNLDEYYKCVKNNAKQSGLITPDPPSDPVCECHCTKQERSELMDGIKKAVGYEGY